MLKNYIRIALKVLARRKFFTFISLFGISLTLLVLMVATAMLDHLFAPHHPETRLDRTLGFHTMAMVGDQGRRSGQPGYAYIDRYLRGIDGVERMTVIQQFSSVTSFHNGRKVKSYLKRTDGEFWKIYDFRFLEGGPFSHADEENANFVAVINEATREKFFGEAPAVGKPIELDGQTFRVVGVVENVPITRLIPFGDVWVPISTNKTDAYRRSDWDNFGAVFLARTRADFPRIRQEVDDRVRNSKPAESETFHSVRGGADTLFETISRVFLGGFAERRSEHLMTILVVLALLFMLLPAVNLVNINLSRIMERSSEIGVRKAFGASSRTLVAQFVVENVILTLVGGLVGLILSALVLHGLNVSDVIPYSEFGVNLRIFIWGLALALTFGILSGVYPAWRMSRLNPVVALRGRSK